jgi:hypothetical protein
MTAFLCFHQAGPRAGNQPRMPARTSHSRRLGLSTGCCSPPKSTCSISRSRRQCWPALQTAQVRCCRVIRMRPYRHCISLSTGAIRVMAPAKHSMCTIDASPLRCAVDLLSQMVISLAEHYVARGSPDYPVGRARLEALGVIGCACIMSVASLEVLQLSAEDLYGGFVHGTPLLVPKRARLKSRCVTAGTVVYVLVGCGGPTPSASLVNCRPHECHPPHTFGQDSLCGQREM